LIEAINFWLNAFIMNMIDAGYSGGFIQLPVMDWRMVVLYRLQLLGKLYSSPWIIRMAPDSLR
jgi:hypothetical protein